MDTKLRSILRKYLRHCEKSGIKRQLECLPRWIQDNYPEYSDVSVELKAIVKLPHKNDLTYRALSAKEKAAIREQRTLAYNKLLKRAYKVRKCKVCATPVELPWDRPTCVSLRSVLWPTSNYCSRECTYQCDALKEKRANTNIQKYGTVCTLSSPEGVSKKKATWLKNYGVENPSHAPKIVGRILKARYGRKLFERKGVSFTYQGYEDVLLNKLLSLSFVRNIQTSACKIGMFAYRCDGKRHKYLPDVKADVRGKTYFFEVKSVGTLAPTLAVARRNWFKAKAMWKAMKNYQVVLCSRNKILEVATNADDLKEMIKRHRRW